MSSTFVLTVVCAETKGYELKLSVIVSDGKKIHIMYPYTKTMFTVLMSKIFRILIFFAFCCATC